MLAQELEIRLRMTQSLALRQCEPLSDNAGGPRGHGHFVNTCSDVQTSAEKLRALAARLQEVREQ